MDEDSGGAQGTHAKWIMEVRKVLRATTGQSAMAKAGVCAGKMEAM